MTCNVLYKCCQVTKLRCPRDIAIGPKCDFYMKVAKLPVCEPVATSHRSRKEIAKWHITFFHKSRLAAQLRRRRDIALGQKCDFNMKVAKRSFCDVAVMSPLQHSTQKGQKIINI